MCWLWRADLGSEEIAYRTAQNLYSLHRSVRVTDPPKWVRQTISTVMPRAMSALPPTGIFAAHKPMSALCQKRTSPCHDSIRG